MHQLLSLGFGPSFLSQLDLDQLADPPVGRVRFAAHGHVRLLTPRGDIPAILAGPLRDPDDPVVVGDWVVYRPDTDPAVADRRLERATLLRRRDPDGSAQPVAANVDVALLCTALGRDFSVRRLERWLALSADAGIDPVIVVTKADAGADVASAIRGVAEVTDAPVVAVSAQDDLGRDALLAHLPAGRTGALLGSSGVGKSTLVNWLRGEAEQATNAVRADERGRHTTTARHLLALPHGAWLIDNPGVRQVGVLEAEGVSGVFADIDALAAACRWRDCAHDAEPGCAVRGAVDSGELTATRLHAWEKLRRELAHEARREDPVARAAERDRWKRIHMDARRRRREEDRE